MEVRCPKCDRLIDTEDINVGTDIAMCRACNETFRLSEALELVKVGDVDLDNPPNGTWFERTFNGFIVGATTRHPVAFFLVPFMCVWSGGALGGIYGSQIVNGEFNLFMSLFGIPFVLGSVLFWSLALMTICGKVEVETDGNNGKVFVGVGSLGWRKQFSWLDISVVREESSQATYPGSRGNSIILEGKQRIKFSSMLSDERRYYMLNVLRKIFAEHGNTRILR